MDDRAHSCCPRIGDQAPDFTARSTTGSIALSDFRGQWLILLSHPSDFTPVCTSEFVALAKSADAFAELSCALVALSIDSLFSHFAWIRAIRDRFGVEIRFPIIEDPTLVIGRGYGMISSEAGNSATVRTTFFIDPNGVIRAMTCYPISVGRSVDELLRMIRALQAVDRAGAMAPEGWQPGDALFRQPAPSLSSVFAAPKATDWFLDQVES